ARCYTARPVLAPDVRLLIVSALVLLPQRRGSCRIRITLRVFESLATPASHDSPANNPLARLPHFYMLILRHMTLHLPKIRYITYVTFLVRKAHRRHAHEKAEAPDSRCHSASRIHDSLTSAMAETPKPGEDPGCYLGALVP